MGQKSNIITLRNTQKSLSFGESEKESRKFLYGFKFYNFFEQMLKKKNVLIVSKTMNFTNNQCYLTLTLFFKMYKLTYYKKRKLKSYFIFNKLKNNTLKNFFFKEFKIFCNNILILTTKNANIKINQRSVNYLYNKVSRFTKILFSRRLNLLVDFIRITALFSSNKVSIQTFLNMLGQIFKFLLKKSHNRFFFFIKYIFQLLIHNKYNILSRHSSIYGIKFVVNGKLRGKPRSDSNCIQIGVVPIQSINKDIEFARLHVYTLYGVFGFRMWIYRKSI